MCASNWVYEAPKSNPSDRRWTANLAPLRTKVLDDETP